jgi:spore germination protein
MQLIQKSISFSVLVSLFVTHLAAAFTVGGMDLPKSTLVSSGTSVHVSAWVPYWRGDSGTAEAQRTMLYIDTFSPFIYEVAADGSIKNKSNLTDKNWDSLISSARANSKYIIPTLIWLKGGEQKTILSNPVTRAKHVAAIVKIMRDNPTFSGIDIDYEGRKSGAQAGFSAFIVNLKKEMQKMNTEMGKYLVCTLETRNPNDAYGSVPTEDRANDFKLLGRECDIVRFMTYDQRNADGVLTRRHDAAGELYMPIADKEWVEKVLVETLKDIPKQKLELGIPTYGHAYRIVKNKPTNTNPNGYQYERMRALTYPQFIERCRTGGSNPTYGASPWRLFCRLQ